jgi:hypothetical protein
MAELYTNDPSTTLNGAITSGDLALTVTSATGFPGGGNFRIRIDNEIILVTAVASNVFTITRGAEGTTAASHSNGATINHYLTAGALDAIRSDMCKSGTLASLPSATKAGNLYYPTDGTGFIHFRDNGSTMEPWYGARKLTSPPTTGWTWDNQSTATVTSTNEGLRFSVPAAAGQNCRVYYRTAPATPYTITAAFVPDVMFDNYMGFSLLFRENSSTKMQALELYHDTSAQSTTNIAPIKWNSPTSAVGSYVTFSYIPMNPVVWMRITDNGTNRLSYLSNTGVDWSLIHSVGRTDFLTADQVGIEVHSENSTSPYGATLIHWEVS